MGSKGQNIFFSSENGHVAYQSKENDTYNNMEAIILSLHATLTPGVGSKGQNSFFLKVVMLPIKYNGNEMDDNMKANILPIHTPAIRGWGSKVKTLFSSDICHVVFQMNRKVGHTHTMNYHG